MAIETRTRRGSRRVIPGPTAAALAAALLAGGCGAEPLSVAESFEQSGFTGD